MHAPLPFNLFSAQRDPDFQNGRCSTPRPPRQVCSNFFSFLSTNTQVTERDKEGSPCLFLSNTIPLPLVSSDGRCFCGFCPPQPPQPSMRLKRVTEGKGRCRRNEGGGFAPPRRFLRRNTARRLGPSSSLPFYTTRGGWPFRHNATRRVGPSSLLFDTT